MVALLLVVVSLTPFATPSGAQAAALQFGACPPSLDGLPERLEAALALYLIVAWRVLYL